MWLTLIRHAEPAYVVDGIAWTDPSLTDRGRRQARLLAERASDWEVDEIWVSSMVRAQETVGPLADVTGVEPETMDWLREISNPPGWDGSPVEEIEEYFASTPTRSIDQLWDGPPGGESFRSFHTRITEGLTGAFAERGVRQADEPTLWTGVDDRRVVVVAHGGTNALILGRLLGVEPTPWEWDRFTHVHSGVSRLATLPTAGHHAWSLRSLNSRTHLPSDLVTA